MQFNEPKYKILVVEDHKDTQQLYKTILENAGHKVFLASTAGEALRLLDTACPESKICYDSTCRAGKCFDAIFLDWDLPDITGGSLATWIRSKFKDVALLIITGYGKLPSIVDISEQVNAALMQKPISPEQLLLHLQIATASINQKRKPKTQNVTSEGIRNLLDLVRIKPKHNI